MKQPPCEQTRMWYATREASRVFNHAQPAGAGSLVMFSCAAFHLPRTPLQIGLFYRVAGGFHEPAERRSDEVLDSNP